MLSQLPDPVDALMMTDVNLLKALQPALPMEVSSEDCAKLAQWVRLLSTMPNNSASNVGNITLMVCS